MNVERIEATFLFPTRVVWNGKQIRKSTEATVSTTLENYEKFLTM